MKKFNVLLNAHGSASYEVEAENVEEAYQKVLHEIAALSDVEASDWDYDNLGEIIDLETNEITDINDIEEV